MSLENRRDPLQQSLVRLSNRLKELAAWRDREWISLGEGEIRGSPSQTWTAIREGDSWPAKNGPVEMRFSGSVPEHWAGLPVHCRFQLGGEALLFINDEPAGGLNPFQNEHPVLDKAQGRETIRFRAEVVPHGLFGTPIIEPRIESACMLIPDTDVRGLFEDLAAALDAAWHHCSAGRRSIAERLVNTVQSAFAGIALPRSDTEEYLARIAWISRSRASESFYGNEESLASLWERWEFRLPSSSLNGVQRERLTEIRQQYARGLELIRADFPTEGGVWLTGHAHIDLAWLWPLDETQRKAVRTFHNIAGLAKRYPELCFNQSSAQLYSWVEERDPGLFDKIRSLVRAGSWEIVGGMWVEPDGNLPAGESWVRQLLYGQRYFDSRFGRRAKVAWLPDSFGFAGNLPQLLKSAGVPFFFTHKLNWNERNSFPYDLYWWEGIDGSRVLAHSFNNSENGYNSRLTAQEVADTWQNFGAKQKHDFTLLAFGYGNGGGGPSADMLERFARLKEFPGLPQLRLGSVGEFYERVSTKSLPVWVGEQYLEYHRATYTTQGRIKGLNRQLEHALIESESAATLALIRWQQPYPKKNLDRLWQTLLLNQFHDILPGSSIHTVYETAHRQLEAAVEDSARLRAEALAAATHQRNSKIANESGGIIWNLQIYDRPLVAEIPIDPSPESRLETSDGKAIPIQRLDGNRLLAIADDLAVPAFGAIAVTVAHGEPTGVSAPVRLSGYEMENACLRVRLREDGTLGSIYDKEYGREVLASRGNQLWLFTDLPRQYDAWDIDASYAEEGMELSVCDPPEPVEEGPLRAALRTRRSHEGIEIVQTYRLSRHSRIVEIHSDIKWCGRRKFLRALFPLAIQTHETWAETSFGAVPRSNHQNTPWDAAKFEMAAHRWIDLSEPDYGVSLLNNGKYGHSAEGNVLGISLLRSPIYPDPYADEGNHQFVYAIYPHRGTWRNGTVRAAQELHSPLRYTEGGLSCDCSSFLKVTGDPVELACFKRAEDSEDLVLRFYEPHGNRGRSLVEFGLPVERAVLVNILEEELEELSVEEGRIITLRFKPFQVISIRLAFARKPR